MTEKRTILNQYKIYKYLLKKKLNIILKDKKK